MTFDVNKTDLKTYKQKDLGTFNILPTPELILQRFSELNGIKNKIALGHDVTIGEINPTETIITALPTSLGYTGTTTITFKIDKTDLNTFKNTDLGTFYVYPTPRLIIDEFNKRNQIKDKLELGNDVIVVDITLESAKIKVSSVSEKYFGENNVKFKIHWDLAKMNPNLDDFDQRPSVEQVLNKFNEVNKSNLNFNDVTVEIKTNNNAIIKTKQYSQNSIGEISVNFYIKGLTQQDTIYIDWQGVQRTTDKFDLSLEPNIREIIQIGFWQNSIYNLVQIVQMPWTVTKVPSYLPKNIQSLEKAFMSTITFNQDLSQWDVSNVLKTNGMFYEAKAFDQDLSKWDISKVTDMTGMFHKAKRFNHSLADWKVDNVKLHDRFAENSPLGEKPENLPKWKH